MAHSDVAWLIARGRVLLARAVEAGWAQGTLAHSGDGVLGTSLSAKEVQALVRRVNSGELAPYAAHAVAVDHAAAPHANGVAAANAPLSPRLGRLLDAVQATRVAPDLLAVLLAAEMDVHARALAIFLGGGVPGNAARVDLLLLALGEAAAADLLAELAAGSGLTRFGFIEVTRKPELLISASTVRLAPRLLRWLVAPDAPDHEVMALATLTPPGAPPLPPAAVSALEPIIVDVQACLGDGRRGRFDVALHGPRGSGRTEIVLEACRRLSRPALLAALGAVAAQPDPAAALAALLREQLLLDAALVLLDGELLADGSALAPRLRSALAAAGCALVVVSSGPDRPRLGGARQLLTHDVPILEAHEREAVWAALAPEGNAAEVASLYRIGVGAITRVAEAALYRAEIRGERKPVLGDVAAAVRAEFATDLGVVATRVHVTQGWDDVVLPDETGRTLVELIAQIKHRSAVLGRWGFQQKLGKGVGTTALFTGEPGTGKSMVAGLIARELGLELYQVDLSRVVSRWLGETEKNLSKVFDAAETGHVVLLFDEADALLGKRTADVKSSNDRYANLETNYVLQRLEAFHGVAILTSNLESAIDPALSRRISFELRFPFPDPAQREELWRRVMPQHTPLAPDVDYRLLAERFEIAGGHIRNIALRAAYLAVDDAAPRLSMAYLLQAAEYEYRDHGKLEAKGRLKQ